MANYKTAAEKIGSLCVQAFQEVPEKLIVEFPAQSPLARTDPSAEENAAFLKGVLGIQAATDGGLAAEYGIGDFSCHPDYPATVRLTLEKGRKRYFFYAACVDETNCLVYEFDRCPTAFRGDSYDLLVFIEIWAEDRKERMIAELGDQMAELQGVDVSTNGTCWLMTFHCGKPAEKGLIDALNAQEHVQLAEQLVPVKV